MGKIFISYCRKDADFAHRLAEKLQDRIAGKVFIDFKINRANFEEALEAEISECNVFVLTVTENTFDQERIHKEDDWIRREIALALELRKHIALALREGKAPPLSHNLPENIRKITAMEGKNIHIASFDDGVDKLAKHCVDISNGALELRPITPPDNLQPRISNSSIGGDNNIHFPGANISQVEINTVPSKLQSLRDEGEKLQRKINYLSYQDKQDFSLNAMIMYLIIILGVVGIGFATSPILGVVAIISVGAWFFARLNGNTTQQESKNLEIANLQHKLRQIQADIEKYQDKM